MIRSSVLFVMVVLAGAAGLAAPAGAVAGPGPVVSLTEFSSQISHDGRQLWPNDDSAQAVDRLTGAKSAAPTCNGDSCWSRGFVRDNPSLVLTFEYGPRPDPTESGNGKPENVAPLLGVFLNDTSSSARLRIDADSAGRPLVAAWRNEGECRSDWCDSFLDYPKIFVGPQSVSRSGRKVAFCSNYARAEVPALYVKDLVTGRLTRTGLRCPVIDGNAGEIQITTPPEISADGRVVHVRGDVWDRDSSLRWTADRLYFTATSKARKVNGWGSMTRDGGTIFMRLSVPKRAVPRWSVRVGAYNVKTGKVEKLAGRDTLYGTPVQWFDAQQRASYRGRFVVGREDTDERSSEVDIWVVDRRTGAKADIVVIMGEQGFYASSSGLPMISGDGTVILARIDTLPELNEMVAITGWESRLVR